MTRHSTTSEPRQGTVLGRGTYGRVVAGKVPPHIGTATAAIKFMPREGRRGAPLAALREIEALTEIDSDRVVRMYHSLVTEKGDVYLYLELMDCNLCQALKRKLTFAQRSSLGAQLVHGVDAIHRCSFAHRDIKPQNIGVCLRSGALKILDFGLARWIDVLSQEHLERTYTVDVVTEWWRAPELLYHGRDPDRHSRRVIYDPFEVDTWSLVVVLFEVFTQRHPFIPGPVGEGDGTMLSMLLSIVWQLGVPPAPTLELLYPGIPNWPARNLHEDVLLPRWAQLAVEGTFRYLPAERLSTACIVELLETNNVSATPVSCLPPTTRPPHPPPFLSCPTGHPLAYGALPKRGTCEGCAATLERKRGRDEEVVECFSCAAACCEFYVCRMCAVSKGDLMAGR